MFVSRIRKCYKLQWICCARFENNTNYNVFLCPIRNCYKLQLFLVPDSKIIQITLFFFVPNSTMIQITIVCVCSIQKCHKLHCFFLCATRKPYKLHCFVVPDSNMIQIIMVFELRCWGSLCFGVMHF